MNLGDILKTAIKDIAEGPAALAKFLAAYEKLESDLPQFMKTVADLKQAASDKSDPVKLTADIDTVLADIQTDLADLAAIIAPPAA